MAIVTMQNLLECGVHFGHQVNRWNPKMKKFIYAARNNIHIIDLQQTIHRIRDAYEAVRRTALANKSVLFVGTKKQSQQIVEEAATKCGMHYVNYHWMGGLLTNFLTISKTITHLKKLEKMQIDGSLDQITKKERMKVNKEISRLNRKFGGLKNMKELPGIIFIIDTRADSLAIAEAQKLNIPIIGIVDTNSDPTHIQYPIPGNDDAIRAIRLYCDILAQGVIEADNEVGLQVIETLQDNEGVLTDGTYPKQEETDETKEVFSSFQSEDFSKYHPDEDKEISEVHIHEEEVAKDSGISETQLYEE